MSSPPDPVPPRVPDYELLRRIGGGSYGDVWIARSVVGAVYRGVKIVTRDRFPDARPYEREYEGLKRFIAVSLRHPGHLALLHAGRNDEAGYFYYVMELADDANTGRHIDPERYVPLTLRTMLRLKGRLPIDDVLDIGVPLAGALANLHAARLVHRDIKPSNIIVVDDIPKLADIGLVTELNEAGTVVGTPGYVPLEGSGTIVGDIYGLGKVLYELATGLSPHEWPLMPDLDEMPERSAFLDLNETLIRACSENPRERFTDASVLRQELRDIQKGRSIRRERMLRRYLRRATQIAAVLAVIAAIGGGGMWIQYERARAAEAERDDLRQQTIYNARLAQALQALEREDYGRARQLLQSAKPGRGEIDRRGFEWRALWQRAEGDISKILRAVGPPIDRLALSDRDGLLAVHDESKTVTLYDTTTYRPRQQIRGIHRLGGFSSDGRWLVGTDASYSLQRWQTSDGHAPDLAHRGEVFRPIGPQGTDSIIAFADGSPPSLVVWNFSLGSETLRLPLGEANDPSPWEFFRAATDERGECVVVVCVNGRSNPSFRLTFARLTGSPAILQQAMPARIGAVSIENDGAYAALDESGEIWHSPDPEHAWQLTPRRFPAFTQKAVSVSFVNTATHIVASEHKIVGVTLSPGDSTFRLRGHSGKLTDLAVSLDHRLVFSAAQDGELRVWPLTASSATHTPIWNSHGSASGLVYSKDSQRVIVPHDGQSIALVEAADLGTRPVFSGMLFPIQATVEGIIGIAADRRGLCLLAPGHVVPQILLRTESDILRASATPDGRTLVLTDADGNLRALTRPGTVAVPLTRGLKNQICLSTGTTGRWIWSATTDRCVRCYARQDGRLQWRKELPALAPHLLASPDELSVFVPLENGQVVVLDASSGEILRAFDSGSTAPQCVALSPDGSRLFVGGLEGNLPVHDVRTWMQITTLPAVAPDPIFALACAPNGSSLAVLTKSGALAVLRAPLSESP